MKIALKKILIEDANKISKWKSDPNLANLILSTSKLTSVSDAITWIQENSRDPNQRINGVYLLNENNELIGITRLMFIDFVSGVAEFGFYIGDETKRGLGYGNIALQLTIDQAFKDLKLRKLFLRVSANNEKALNLYLKYNFIKEGLLKEHYYNLDFNRFEDIIYMSLFNSENK